MKVGRNDPCPCGSGKKYKKCCIQERHKPYYLKSKRDIAALVGMSTYLVQPWK